MNNIDLINICSKKQKKNLFQFLHVLIYFHKKNIKFINEGIPESHVEYLNHQYEEELEKVRDLINSFEMIIRENDV